jgi:hypothetical protein
LKHPARPFQAKNYLTRINASEFCVLWSRAAVTKPAGSFDEPPCRYAAPQIRFRLR